MYEPNRLIMWSESSFYAQAGKRTGVSVAPFQVFIGQEEQASKDAQR